jgi:UrcA family protein
MRTVRSNLHLIIAIGAMSVTGAQAANMQEVTVTPPTAKTIGLDATGARIREVTATARVQYNPISLTTNSGRALLDDKVADVAHRLCTADAIASNTDDDGSCVQHAMEGAKAQLDAAAARVRGQ